MPTADELRQWFAANVAAVRKRRGWTQATLAERAGIDLITVQHLEGARKTAKITTLVALARALGVTTDALLRPRRLVKASRGRPKRSPPKAR